MYEINKRLKLKAVSYCPVTGNNPTVCTRASFMRACQKYRREIHHKGGAMDLKASHNYCAICKGRRIPPGVIFVDVDDFMPVIHKTPAVQEHYRE